MTEELATKNSIQTTDVMNWFFFKSQSYLTVIYDKKKRQICANVDQRPTLMCIFVQYLQWL